MTARYPAWMFVVSFVQIALAGLFALFAYSETWANSQGRWSPSAEDMIFLLLPVVAVVLLTVLGWMAARRDRRGLAAILILSPVPLVLLVYTLTGAV